ncbi:DNA polymerase III subunit alpha [Gemella sp. zg-570]|uniref:DNA polymerase III subunit alpha n=1 Tax=Gemella sp. zg-570 TaxID=2840371 RepID=UPI001C0E55C0|nr:DNA polymerase III subunit alpha [Gemella sp. zg-570]QWQ38304.1 DNA polymerase III subunit alpha [Gemella sp. zg-570]
MKYYNLQVHTSYDLLNSTIKLENLFQKLEADKQEAVCITDPNMYAAIQSHKLAKKYNISLIQALEIKVSNELDFLNLNILCKNEKMFKQLLKISSLIQTKGKEFSLEEIAETLSDFKDDCLLIVASEIFSVNQAKDIVEKIKNLDYYFAFNESYNYKVYQYISKLVYSKASYYLDYNNYQTLVVARAIRDNRKLNIEELVVTRGNDFVYTQDNIIKLLDNIINPLAKNLLKKAIARQEEIIKKTKYSLEFKGYHLPKYVYNKDEEIFKQKSSLEYLHYLVVKGAKQKLGGKDFYKYKKRFDYELKTIYEMGFADYFLIVRDFVKYAKENGIAVGAGRGSAAGSLVCYLLDITEADPLEFNLLFERFLNKDRISMPDIDIDFQDTRRDEVIKYVEEKYGSNRVAQIITFNTFQSKSAARESARILQFSDENLKYISRLINSRMSLEECYEENLDLRNFVHSSQQNERWFSVAKSLENLPRNTSVHAAGLIISDENNLYNYTALEKGNLVSNLTQWTMDDIEYVGLLKIDFLGIRYLTMVDNIVKEIQKTEKNFDIKNISYKDKNVYKLFAEGKTEGIFQFENSGIKEKLRLLQPTEFNDVVAMTSLYRPGPMSHIETYINRKHGKENVKYPHPKLEKILKDTYGVIVYQEQIMLIAVNFANMSLNEADNMRRAVSKKKKEDLEYYGKIFIEKSVSSGYDLKIAQAIFEMIVTFANYGFNKSHAVVYSMLAYKLAYLKYYYNHYFMTALLNNVVNSENKINEYKQELNIHNIKLLNPDVNISGINFTVNKNNISFALVAIKNVGFRSATEIVNDRLNFGKYLDIDDFLRRMNKKVDYQAATSLVKAGALDSFGYNRATVMKKIKDYYEDTRQHIDKVRFAINTEGLTLKIEEVEDYTVQEKIKMEKEVTGTYFLKHPAQVEKEKYHYLPLKYLTNESSDSYVEVINIKEIKTKKGDTMAFLTVNDGKADYDLTVFPNVYKYVLAMLKTNNFFVISVKAQIRNDRLQYILEKIRTLEKYRDYCLNNIKQIYVLIDEENINFVKEYIASDAKVKLISVFKNNKITKKTHIKNEQEFVCKFLESYPEKAIKLTYT